LSLEKYETYSTYLSNYIISMNIQYFINFAKNINGT
jgi:hypothetical protein